MIKRNTNYRTTPQLVDLMLNYNCVRTYAYFLLIKHFYTDSKLRKKGLYLIARDLNISTDTLKRYLEFFIKQEWVIEHETYFEFITCNQMQSLCGFKINKYTTSFRVLKSDNINTVITRIRGKQLERNIIQQQYIVKQKYDKYDLLKRKTSPTSFISKLQLNKIEQWQENGELGQDVNDAESQKVFNKNWDRVTISNKSIGELIGGFSQETGKRIQHKLNNLGLIISIRVIDFVKRCSSYREFRLYLQEHVLPTGKFFYKHGVIYENMANSIQLKGDTCGKI